MLEHPSPDRLAPERIATRIRHPGPFEPGGTVRLDADRAHHLRHVLRLAEGATVALFDAAHGEWTARVSAFGKRDATLEIGTCRRAPEPAGPDVWLLMAPIQRDRLETVVEKATELGVARIMLVATARTQGGRVNVDRLAAIATAAAEQCERLDVPMIAAPEPLEAVLRGWPADRMLMVAAEAGEARPVAAAMRAGVASPEGAAMHAGAVLVGPEGGFTSAELDALRKLPFLCHVGLGPRVLRADTAAVALLACWQALAGDWTAGGEDRRPPFRG